MNPSHSFPALSKERIAAIESSFASQGLMQTLGAQLRSVASGHVVIALPFSAAVSQQHGFFHGGVIGALADTACGYAAISLCGPGESGLTAEYKINLLRPGDGEQLIAEGKVLKHGKTLSVTEADVWVEKKGERKLCARAIVTLCTVRGLNAL